MATKTFPCASIQLPSVPVPQKDFVSYLSQHPNERVVDLVGPFKAYESKLRQVFSQQPTHEAAQNNHVNLVPIYAGHEGDIKVRARNVQAEVEEEREKYIMPLTDEARLPDGSSAVVPTLKDFRTNFGIFSEASMADMDWSNVVVAGSAVTTSLLPVPDKYKGSKRLLREYYHEKLAPASDVDLFIYGLNEEQAIEKIKQIDKKIRDAILSESTAVRTKHAITIASQYPIRHVQIVLRLYRSVSEILAGFDVDCACVAYDGSQVYASPRALASFVTQCNTIDLTRRSPSYENRLSKYARRGFEVYWPELERNRVDPTIYERSFASTKGLARLLLLEKLPKQGDREAYIDQRRRERGRPNADRSRGRKRMISGNIKDEDEEIADWVEDDEDVSSYHTFSVPYGPRIHARRIEKMLYTKDILLNAEWNTQKDRDVNLHRHPAFFGFVEDIVKDCCGYCPAPATDEEKEVAEVESKIYISGDISFLKDDPGRQSVGSFNPITTDDWTEMAYLGNTALLCQAIVDGDLAYVKEWCNQDGVDINRRDYTGRTPLHLAVLSSTYEIVQCLIDHGARLVARLVDGKTALHLAMARGEPAIVKALLDKSEANEEEEAKKEEDRKALKSREALSNTEQDAPGETAPEEDEDYDKVTAHEKESVAVNTEGSFLKVDSPADPTTNMDLDKLEAENEPDIYDINVLAWDFGLSPLHLAIIHRREKLIELLVSEYGADLLLPAKPPPEHSWSRKSVALNLNLAMHATEESCLVRTLLKLGASSAQADTNKTSALHFAVALKKREVLDIMFEEDLPAAKRIINYISHTGAWSSRYSRPLITAITTQDDILVEKLLRHGAHLTTSYEEWASILAEGDGTYYGWRSNFHRSLEEKQSEFRQSVKQAFELAITKESPESLLKLVEYGLDLNSLTVQGQQVLLNKDRREKETGETILDLLRARLNHLRSYTGERLSLLAPEKLQDDNHYLAPFQKGGYLHWTASCKLSVQKDMLNSKQKSNEEEYRKFHDRPGILEKQAFIEGLIKLFEQLESLLISKGAKTFKELHPSIEPIERSLSNTRSSPSPKPDAYKIRFTFNVSVPTEEIEQGYQRLFEAAWNGDTQTIKALTLANWGPRAENVPLMVAVRDSQGLSPFFIAILRGHLSAARIIIDVADVQYERPEKPRKEYNMADSDDGSECGDDNQMPIYGELVDETFTIDDLGAVSKSVKSNVSPQNVLGMVWRFNRGPEKDRILDSVNINFQGSNKDWDSADALEYAIRNNDVELTKFLLNLGNEFTARYAERDEPRIFQVAQADFELAIRLGAIGPLAEMVRICGAGIPLDFLSQRFGVQVRKHSDYYQGLIVHGRKRGDWAQRKRDETIWLNEKCRPPLLVAAHAGNIDSIEWFLGDSPARLYKEFAENNQKDDRIRSLSQASAGLDRIISSWLGARRNLAIHCAVMVDDSKKRQSITEYLLSAVNKSLNTKSNDGYTPLSLAYYSNHVNLARVLIAAGADQTIRDKDGRNIVHLLVDAYNRDVNRLKEMLDLIDKRVLPGLLFERTAEGHGAQTPLVRCIWQAADNVTYGPEHDDKSIKPVELLLQYSGGKDLEVLNREGDTPLHVCVRHSWPRAAALIMSLRPELVHRENANGRTPLEVAEDKYVRELVDRAANVYIPTTEDNTFTSCVNRNVESFVHPEQPHGPDSRVERTYRACLATSQRCPQPRKLASLAEANEVAARLSRAHERQRASEKKKSQSDSGDDDVNMDECKRDEVNFYM